FDNIPSSGFFPVPMAMHPLFYHKKLWDHSYVKTERKRNSVFMIGNFDKQYHQFNEELFGMESRLTVLNFLKKKCILSEVNSKEEFYDFLKSSSDKECIILDRINFSSEI